MVESNDILPTRAAGLRQLESFLPKISSYAALRNWDDGTHQNVSRLSPYISHRLLTESEIVRAVRDQHCARVTDKFVQEICWRTYWKGWLQLRPQVWVDYKQECKNALDNLDRKQRKIYENAIIGNTEIDCFNYWLRELIETNYLHNHARMWFASIWIFTLKLPWTLGADLFFRHLLDGDAASNTLSWRWVAGLHTQGKHYLARADNIEHFTNKRFNPAGQLCEDAPPIVGYVNPITQKIQVSQPINSNARSGWLMLGDDLSIETIDCGIKNVVSMAAGWSKDIEENFDLAPAVVRFKNGALNDTLERAKKKLTIHTKFLDAEAWSEDVLTWVEQQHLQQVICLETPVGPWREILIPLQKRLLARGVKLVEVTRAWDKTLWPLATGGFFGFYKKARNKLDMLH